MAGDGGWEQRWLARGLRNDMRIDGGNGPNTHASAQRE